MSSQTWYMYYYSHAAGVVDSSSFCFFRLLSGLAFWIQGSRYSGMVVRQCAGLRPGLARREEKKWGEGKGVDAGQKRA